MPCPACDNKVFNCGQQCNKDPNQEYGVGWIMDYGFHVRKMQKLLGWRHIKYFLTRPSKNKMWSHHHLSSSWLIALSCVCHHLGKWKILEFEDKISTPNVVYYPELYESNIELELENRNQKRIWRLIFTWSILELKDKISTWFCPVSPRAITSSKFIERRISILSNMSRDFAAYSI